MATRELQINTKTRGSVAKVVWFEIGGEPGRCGWLKDKFGLSWQIIPSVLGDMLQDEDEAKSQRVMQAMLQMDKLDIARLKQAYAGQP